MNPSPKTIRILLPLCALLVSNFVIAQDSKSPAKFKKKSYEISLGGCITQEKMQLKRIGDNLYKNKKGTLFFLSYSVPNEKTGTGEPIFIQRFMNNCANYVGEDTVVDFSSFDIGNCIDAKSFEEIEPGKYKDKWRYYRFTAMSDGGHLSKGKAHSYEVLENGFFLGSDNEVYIQTQQLIRPPEEYTDVFYRKVPVADPGSYNIDFSGYYAKDTINVYRDWATTDGRSITIIPEADAATFEVIFYRLAKDKNHVYYNGNIIKDLNADSLVIICNEPSEDYLASYTLIKDNKSVYYTSKILNSIHAPSFECILTKDGIVYRDKYWVYEEDYFRHEEPEYRVKRD